jgi:hypothetical protein
MLVAKGMVRSEDLRERVDSEDLLTQPLLYSEDLFVGGVVDGAGS